MKNDKNISLKRKETNMKSVCTSALVMSMLVVMLSMDATAEDERVSLFNGKDLEGWTVLQCEATVDNGEILIQAGNGLIQSEKKYGDFILEFEWKALAEG
jgi:hypothetical protein